MAEKKEPVAKDEGVEKKPAEVVEISTKKKRLSAKDILAVEDLQPLPYDVPEWGGEVLIRRLSAKQGIEIGDKVGDLTKSGANTKLCLYGLCDDDGRQLFSDSELAELETKSLKVINRVGTEVLRVNGLIKDPAEMKEAVKKD